jgi:hypothetical protein
MGSLFRAAVVSWKTSLVGALVFLESLAATLVAMLDDEASTEPDWNGVVMAFMVFVALLTAKDADKSTEDHKPNGS